MISAKAAVVVVFSLASCVASAEWRYYSATDAESAHPGTAYISDGNWELKLTSWTATSFATSGNWANSYLAGSGKLDLAAAQSDLGRKLSTAGKYNAATQITEIVFPDDYTDIVSYQCDGCTSLVKASGGKLMSVGAHAFAGCSALQTFDFDLSEVTSIGELAFNCGSGLALDLDLPALTYLGRRPFTLGTGLSPCQFKSFRAPLLTAIPEGAFWNCIVLTNVVVSPGLTSIGKQAFSGCTALASLSPSLLPTTISVSSIAQETFLNCSALTVPVTISDPNEGTVSFNINAFKNAGFTSVDMSKSKCCFDVLRAFYGCNRLEEVWFAPAQTNLWPASPGAGVSATSIFGTGLRRFYFTGVAPNFTTISSYLTSGCANYRITAYADPKLDSNWRPENVPGFRALTDAEIAMLGDDSYPDAKAAYAEGNLLGTWSTGGSARMWYVKYRSPLRVSKGLILTIR